MNHSARLFYILNIVSTLMFVSWMVGSVFLPSLIPNFTAIYEIYMALFLIFRFNPVTNKNVTFNATDRNVVVSAAASLLVANFTYIYHLSTYIPVVPLRI